MKKILLAVALLVGVIANAQLPSKPGNVTDVNQQYQHLGLYPYMFAVPGRAANDTSFKPGQWRKAGQMVHDSVSKKTYIWTGGVLPYWKELGSGGDSGLFGRTDTRNASGSALDFSNAGLGGILDSLSSADNEFVMLGYGGDGDPFENAFRFSAGGGGVIATSTNLSNSTFGNITVTPTLVQLTQTTNSHTVEVNTDSVKIFTTLISPDTTTFKPIGVSPTGGIARLNRWPGSGGGGGATISMDSVAYYSDVFGLIYNDSAWSNPEFTSHFFDNSSGATDSAGHIVISGGASNLTKTLDVNINQKYGITPYYTNLENWSFEIKARLIIHGLIPIGIRSSTTLTSTSTIYGFLNTSTGQSQIVAASAVASSATNLTISGGDYFKLKLERNGNKLTLSVRNLTTNSAEIRTVSYILYQSTSPPVTGRFAIFNYSGKFYVDSIGISSTIATRGAVAIIGDSKSQLYPSLGTDGRRWGTLLADVYPVVMHAGRGEQVSDWLNSLPEVLALKPRQVIIGGASNDQRGSVNLDSTKARYYRLERGLRDAGIAVYHIDGIYETSIDVSGWASYIRSSRSADSVFAVYYPTSVSGTVEADNIHPNGYANQIISDFIINSGKLKGPYNSYGSVYNTLQNRQTTEPPQPYNYNFSGNAKQTGSFQLVGAADIGTAAAATALSNIPLRVRIGSAANIYAFSGGSEGNTFAWANNTGVPLASNKVEGNIKAQPFGIYTGTSSNILSIYASAGLVGIGHNSPDALLHTELANTSTNTVDEVTRVSHVTSATSAAGFGIREAFETESANGVNKVTGARDLVLTDATAGSEDADLSFLLALNGTLTEAIRFKGTGELAIKRIQNTSALDSVLVQDGGLVKYIDLSGATGVTSGTYTATITAGTNTASASQVYDFQYSRIGNIVTFSGYVQFTPTLANTNSTFGISLPIASNFSGAGQAFGVLNNSGAQTGGVVDSDGTNDRLQVLYYPTTTNAVNLYIVGQYRVI